MRKLSLLLIPFFLCMLIFSNLRLNTVSATTVMKAGIDIWSGTTASTFNASFVSLLQELGIGYIRIDFEDSYIANVRTLVPAIINNGFKVLGLLFEKSYAPANVEGWATWVYNRVNEFKANVHLWECWNEPNLEETFFNGGTAQQYADFLEACYDQAKTADPTCIVLGGSIAFTHSASLEYLQILYDNGAKDHMDFLAYHPYCNPYAPNDTESTPNPYIYLTNVKDLMEENGDYRNIWITELGWQSDTPLTQTLQSNYTTQALTYAYNWTWIEGYIIYKMRDSGGNYKGICTSDLTPKLVFYAVKQFIADYIPIQPYEVTVTVFHPENIIYAVSTIPVEITANGGVIDLIWYNCKNGTDWVYLSNQTYVGSTNMLNFVNGTYTFYGWANNTDFNSDEQTVIFTVSIPSVTIPEIPETVGGISKEFITALAGFAIAMFCISLIYKKVT